MGKDYSIDYSNTFYTTNSDGTVNVAIDINYKGYKVLDGQIHNLPAEYKKENKNLDNLTINVLMQDKGDAGLFDSHLLSIDGICINDEISKITKQFGESEETTTDSTGGAYRYHKNKDKHYGVTFFFEHDKVFSVMFRYNMNI